MELKKWTGIFTGLLPKGSLWEIKEGSKRDAFHKATAAELSRIDGLIKNLQKEITPATCDATLPEWTEAYDIHPGLSDRVKKNVAASYFSLTGSQSLTYLQEKIGTLMLDITIETNTPGQEVIINGLLTEEEAVQVQKLMEAIVPLNLTLKYNIRYISSSWAESGLGESGSAETYNIRSNYE